MSADVTMERDGVTYRLLKLKPAQAMIVAAKVGKALAAAGDDAATLAKVAGAGDNQALIGALAAAMQKIDGEALINEGIAAVVGRLFTPTGKISNIDDFNDWFADRMDHMFPVLIWALKENVAGFFGSNGRPSHVGGGPARA